MATIAKGTLLSFCGGSYSDKWDYGPFEVLKDFDQKEVADAYVAQYVGRHEWDRPDEHGFVSWMTASGYIEDVPNSYSWYVGDYEFAPVIAP
jgi:hypothetical protein